MSISPVYGKTLVGLLMSDALRSPNLLSTADLKFIASMILISLIGAGFVGVEGSVGGHVVTTLLCAFMVSVAVADKSQS